MAENKGDTQRTDRELLILKLSNNPVNFNQKMTPQCWVYSSLHFLLNYIEVCFGLSLDFTSCINRFKEECDNKDSLLKTGGNFLMLISGYLRKSIKLIGQQDNFYIIKDLKFTLITCKDFLNNLDLVMDRLNNGLYFYIGIQFEKDKGHAMCVTSITKTHFICSNSWLSEPIVKVSFDLDFHLIMIDDLCLWDINKEHDCAVKEPLDFKSYINNVNKVPSAVSTDLEMVISKFKNIKVDDVTLNDDLNKLLTFH